uniref:Uncharacterized protein n=1 Tax=Ixodes ricinus TaxID=34613 RepID=A0A147BQ73_IXORI
MLDGVLNRVLNRVLGGVLEGVLSWVLQGVLSWVLLGGPNGVALSGGVAGGIPFRLVAVLCGVPALSVWGLVWLPDAQLLSAYVAALRILVAWVVAAVVGWHRCCAVGRVLGVALVGGQGPLWGVPTRRPSR